MLSLSTYEDLPACLSITSQHSDLADPAMTMVGRIAPIVLGFSDTPAIADAPLPSLIQPQRHSPRHDLALLHGCLSIEAHQMRLTVVSDC